MPRHYAAPVRDYSSLKARSLMSTSIGRLWVVLLRQGFRFLILKWLLKIGNILNKKCYREH